MLVSIETDYAISVLCLIAQRKDIVTTSEVIRTIGGSSGNIRKLLIKLKGAELIKYVENNKVKEHGGYILSKGAGDITLLDVVQVTEKTMNISRSLGSSDTGLCNDAMDHNKLNKIFEQIRGNILEAFESTTIIDFLSRL